jgi:hypothetical protein
MEVYYSRKCSFDEHVLHCRDLYGRWTMRLDDDRSCSSEQCMRKVYSMETVSPGVGNLFGARAGSEVWKQPAGQGTNTWLQLTFIINVLTDFIVY